MPEWICPEEGCPIWVFAPEVRPIHAIAPNPNFQAKDPHCPIHKVPLVWTPDAVQSAPDLGVASTTAPNLAVASTTKIGFVHEKLGILVTRFENLDVYCDYHQRKHVYNGKWPGGVPTDKPVFLPRIYNQDNLGLCTYLADSVPWGNFRTVIGGVDIIFDCGRTVVGTENETYILVQGGFQKEGRGYVITFHAYPVDNDGPRQSTFRSCKLNDRLFPLTEAAKFLSLGEKKEEKEKKEKKEEKEGKGGREEKEKKEKK